MSYRFEATDDFLTSVGEVIRLYDMSEMDNENEELLLKLASVSLITKFQVYVEKVLEEYKFNLQGKNSNEIDEYMKMNALRLSLIDEKNPLVQYAKNATLTAEKKQKIKDYISSLAYINENIILESDFYFNTKFPLGKTGRSELVALLKQIDGDEDPFSGFPEIGEFDSALFLRHSIVHQDRFFGTNTSVKRNIEVVKSLVIYIDTYLESKMT